MNWWEQVHTIERDPDALDLVFNHYDDLLLQGEFERADDELRQVDISKITSSSVLYGIACAASWPGPRPFLNDIIDQVEARLLEVLQDPPRVERLLKNLKNKSQYPSEASSNGA